MTSDQYAALVVETIHGARQALTLTAHEDDVPLVYAFEDLAKLATHRVLGIGRHQYEIRPDEQRFESDSVQQMLSEARDEVVDIPCYATQIAWRLGAPEDVDVRRVIAMCAELLVTLNRIEARAADCG